MPPKWTQRPMVGRGVQEIPPSIPTDSRSNPRTRKCQERVQEHRSQAQTRSLGRNHRRGRSRERHLVTGQWWRKAKDRFQPPLVDSHRSISDPAERSAYLGDRLLRRKTAGEDITDPWAEYLPANPNIKWDSAVTKEEAKNATTGSGNAAPGADGISVALLQLAWSAIEDFVTDHFRGCLKIGQYPLPFRSAEVTIIPKPGKKPQAYTIPHPKASGLSPYFPALARGWNASSPREFPSWPSSSKSSLNNISGLSRSDPQPTSSPALFTTSR